MEKNFPPYQKLDMDRWPRREHYYYYRQKLQCGYTVTVRLDVTETLAFSRREGLRFYGCFLYAAAKTVNETEEMRLMVNHCMQEYCNELKLMKEFWASGSPNL